ncbi:MAG TPA: HAMP domain-containing sensor histidine kinase [Solirubrobacteraceae bacterium]|nr:HAMP domain-containing sensor histidine kinase [Solirubrobacteraceae bacterium]
MGTASGVVAALVAAVFAILVTAVRDQRDASAHAGQADAVSARALEVARAVTIVAIGERGGLAGDRDVRRARLSMPGQLATLRAEVGGQEPQRTQALRLTRRAQRWLADSRSESAPALEAAALRISDDEVAMAQARRREADGKARQAIALGVGGLIGSALLIALLTTYLARYVVVPVRRTVRAARRLARGDLSARVEEQGDTEPVELARAFNQMASTLEESERLKDEFFALVSHELRTPLTSIIGYLDLLLDDAGELDADARRFLEVVDRNAKRLLRLVGDMLFVAQVEAGRLSLSRSAIDLREVAVEAVEAGQPAARRGGVELALDADQVRPLDGDRDRFGQMLDNLVSNAVKFTPDGGHVVVRLRDTPTAAVVEVADDGIGIAEADKARLFERFFRAPTAMSRAVPGAGLGLTIVKTIVEAHGGAISLASTEGAGTTVRVELPYAPIGAVVT